MRTFLRGLGAAVIAVGGTIASSVAAAPAAPPDTAVYEVPPVVVGATRPRTTTGGASTVTLRLDSTLVRPAPTLENALRAMPLVVVRANSRGEAQPALRGGEDRQIAVLVDGVPITLAWDHRTDLSVVPLGAARSLTLHRGMSSLLHGPNALAGAVEMDIGRGRHADEAPPPLTLSGAVDQTGALNAALNAGTLRSNAGGRWLIRGGAGFRTTDGAALARGLRSADPATYARLTDDGDRRLNTDVDGMDGFLSLRRVNASGAWAAVTGTGFQLERGVAPEAHTSEPRLWRYPFQSRLLSAVSGGTGMRETPWGRGDLEASFGMDVGRTEIDAYDSLDYRNVVSTERDDDRTLTARMIGDHTLGEQGELRLGLTFADVLHDEVIDAGSQATYQQQLWSLATEGEWGLQTGVPVRLSAGVAADGANTLKSSDKPPLETLWDWGGRLGATALFQDGKLRAHASTGRRTRFPALRELYSGALGRFLENPDLGPEVQWTTEGGVTARHRRGELQLVGFHEGLEDASRRVSVSTPTGNKFQRVNLGRTTATGVEVIGDLASGPFAFGASATLQRVRGLDATGHDTELEYEPAIFGKISAEAPLPGRLRAGVEVHGMGEQHYVDLDSGNFSTLAPGGWASARISRTFDLRSAGPWRRADLVLSFENLTDEAVYDQAGLPTPGRTIRLQAQLW